jgi:WASH complex subunit strumpellin
MMAHEISIFADGVLSMDNSIIGGIEINPRKLLNEGLRKEMVHHVSELMNSLLQFDFAADSETVASMTKHQAAAMRSLASLSRRLEGFQSALECIEDFVSIHGLKMWHEEFSRIINYNVEQEVNKYLLKKVLDADSAFQSEIVPIPRFPRTQNEPTCINFMGRMVSMLIKMTDTQYTTFSIEKSGWFMSDGTEVCGLKTVSLLRQAVGVCGLTGIDRLLCYRILHELHRFVKFFRTNVTKQGVLLEQLRDELYPEWKTPTKAVSIYASGAKKAEMLMLPMLTCFRRIGQAQMLRRMIRFELGRCSRIDAKMLLQSVSTLNASILSSENPLEQSPAGMKKFCDMSLAVGIGDPLQTVFMATDPLEGLPVLLLLFLITYVPKLSYNAMFGSLSKTKSGYPIDGWPLIAGISTLLKQFHPSYSKSFLAYVGQFVRVSITTYFERKQVKKEVVSRLTEDLRSTLVLVNQFCDISSIPKSALHEHIPQFLMEMCNDL